MPESLLETAECFEDEGKRKKPRFTSGKVFNPSPNSPSQRTLELEGVIEVLKEYDSLEGTDIHCCICGKLYKSKVCFTKHLWEHSVYWDFFDELKNQERVLSIQAAIILSSNPLLSFLLVTSPNTSALEKKKEDTKPESPKKLIKKRKRVNSVDL